MGPRRIGLLLLLLASSAFARDSAEQAYSIVYDSKPTQELVASGGDDHHPVFPPFPFKPPPPEEPPVKPEPPPPHHHHHSPPPPVKPEPEPKPLPPPPHHHHHSPPPPVKPEPEPKPLPPPPHHDRSPPPPVPPSPPPHFPAAVLSDLKISKGKLVPKFDPDVHNYSASVSSKVKKVQITASVPDAYEKHKYYTITINEIPVKSGVPSPQLKVGKAGKTVVYEIAVALAEHEPSTYYLSVHRGKSKWQSFGAKLLLALAIILLIAVLAFLGYGLYVCIKSGRAPAVWPFTYFSRNRDDEYSSLSPGPASSRP